jgi:3-isopropylmalate/(R)-2-methylmalate dehydratase large subunit
VFCHEITTPIAINDLVRRGRDQVFDPTKIKAVIDHVTPAKDSKTATQGKILRDWARRHGIQDFFDIGSNGVDQAVLTIRTADGGEPVPFTISDFDRALVTAGGWLEYAAGKY